MMNLYISIEKIEPEWTKEDCETWLLNEIRDVRKRFGSDKEALQYWPDDYYQKMEIWWDSCGKYSEPILVRTDAKNIVRIVDGWHRFAISHKLSHPLVPVQFE